MDHCEAVNLAELFGEREVQLFGAAPQTILNAFAEILLSQYARSGEKLPMALREQCRSFLSPSQIEAVYFEARLDECFQRFEDYVYGNAILAVPPSFAMPVHRHLQVASATAVPLILCSSTQSEEELDKQIRDVSEKLSATAYVNAQLEQELRLLDAESLRLGGIEAQFASINSILARFNLGANFEQATWHYSRHMDHLLRVVNEMLDLSSSHLFQQGNASADPAVPEDEDDIRAYTTSQQRLLREFICGVASGGATTGGASSSERRYAEEWVGYAAIGSIEDISVTALPAYTSRILVVGLEGGAPLKRE